MNTQKIIKIAIISSLLIFIALEFRTCIVRSMPRESFTITKDVTVGSVEMYPKIFAINDISENTRYRIRYRDIEPIFHRFDSSLIGQTVTITYVDEPSVFGRLAANYKMVRMNKGDSVYFDFILYGE